jgi:O-6-methylguanine DNA methyltransferase
MLAERLTTAMENELVGQRRAIEALVRSVTIAQSGLTDSDAPAGMFLFLGPSGTGKSHAARALTRVLHGDLEKLLVVDCVQLDEQGDWQELVRQMAPHFREPVPGHGEQLRAMAPMSVLLVEHLEAAGTEFQRRTWNALQAIPYGETISYAELACRVGSPKAARAVGTANGANPLPIVIPCHRVIGSNGKLTGYGGGLDIKQQLLKLEGARLV